MREIGQAAGEIVVVLGLREVGGQEDHPLDEERKGAGQREQG